MSWADDASEKELATTNYYVSDDTDEPEEWTTKDGTTLLVKDMETSHIRNCIAMLHRTIASRPDEYAWGEPENDSDAYQGFMGEIRHNDILEQEMKEQIEAFNRELKSREESK